MTTENGHPLLFYFPSLPTFPFDMALRMSRPHRSQNTEKESALSDSNTHF